MRNVRGWIVGISLTCAGCATEFSPTASLTKEANSLVVGRVVAVVTGDTTRIYEPAVRFFEVENRQTHHRFDVEIKSEDRHFAIELSPGDYQLTRVQISEGPFMSMAEIGADFSVKPETVTYVGTWRFGVESPRYGRMVALSMVIDPADRSQANAFLAEQYPSLQGVPVSATIPVPSTMEERLYEVMPYPRYPTYFRRHNW